VTVFLTTHYLEEAERLCDRIAIIVKGRIVALDSVDGLKGGTQGKTAVEVTLADADGHVESRRVEGDDVAAAAKAALAQANDQRVLAINTIRPTLEDVFVKLTGLSAEVMLAEKSGKGGGNAGG
jgi:ABC-2 type transport system ATP-binding protein